MYFEILEVVLSVYLLIYDAIHYEHIEYLKRGTDEIMLTACSSLVYILKFELYIQNKYIYMCICVCVQLKWRNPTLLFVVCVCYRHIHKQLSQCKVLTFAIYSYSLSYLGFSPGFVNKER